MARRVVITGMGPITPIGIGSAQVLNSLAHPFSGVGPIRSIDVSLYGKGELQGAEIKGFNLDDYFRGELQNEINGNGFDRKVYNRIKDCDRAIQFGVAASKLALEDSALTYNREDNRVGIYLGNAEECIESYEHQIALTIQKVMRKVFKSFSETVKPFHYFQARRKFKEHEGILDSKKLPEFIAFLQTNYGSIKELVGPDTLDFKAYSIPTRIAGFFGLHGQALSLNTSCASGLDAIGHAFREIKHGDSEVMLAGGTEAPITLESMASLDHLKVITRTKPRPYDSRRDGFAIGEGAGVVVLEELERARARGSKIYAEILGYGQSNDAGRNIFALDTSGTFLARSISDAISESGVSSEEIDYINSHGTSTRSCDKVETLAIKKALKDQAHRLHISSTKPMTGHSIGSIGGIETIITCLGIQNDLVPATLNLEEQDPDCDLNYTPNTPVSKKIRSALITSMGFGGYNSALLVSKNHL